MKHTRRILRAVAGPLAVLAVLVLWHPQRAESQGSDLVAQGRQAILANKFDDALALFQKAVAADPNDPAALVWLGNAQVRKAGTVGGMEGAAWVKRGFNTMDEAVERFPNTYVVYVVRGIMAARTPEMFKKAPVAVKDLKTVLAMREKDAKSVPDAVMLNVYLHLGRAYKQTGQSAEARAALEKGKALFPSAPEIAEVDRELRGL